MPPAASRTDHCPVRLRPILLLVLALPVFAGCSGADAGRAQLLLKQAQDAQTAVSSEAFSMHVTVEAKGQKVQVLLNGGAYLKGSRAGDMVMDVKISAPVALPFDTDPDREGRPERVDGDERPAHGLPRVHRRDDAVEHARRSSTSRATSRTSRCRADRCSKGKPVTKIVGILDTAALIQGMAKLGNVAGSAGLPGLGGKVGDTRVVIFVDDTTHLLVAALADVTMNSDSGNVKLHLDLAISGVNRPVAALSPA